MGGQKLTQPDACEGDIMPGECVRFQVAATSATRSGTYKMRGVGCRVRGKSAGLKCGDFCAEHKCGVTALRNWPGVFSPNEEWSC